MKLSQTVLQSESEFLPVFIRQEFSLYRHVEKTLLQIAGDVLAVADSLAVFFCSHDDRSREVIAGIPYRVDIRFAELMMIREVEMLDDLIVIGQLSCKRLIVGDAGEQDKVLCVQVA